MGSRLRAFRSIVVVCLMCIGARPRSTSEANPVGTASPPVRRRCNSYVLLWWRVLLLLLHCGHIITVTWKSCAPRREPIPSGRSPAGFPLGMPQRTQTPTRTCAQFCCAYCATAMSNLPVQGMGYPAACATLIRAASARAHRKSRPRCNLACSLC